jgi:Protein of unknown function (DUF993)
MTTIRLPRRDGSLLSYTARGDSPYPASATPAASRIAYAAAHVVADPLADVTPASQPSIDWDATLAFRRHLWSLGLGVAEAMDTAQRGMGLDWSLARELVERTCAEADRGMVVAGAQTDQLVPGSARSLDDVVAAYAQQCEAVEAAGATVVVMASRELCRIASSPDDYVAVYGKILTGVSRPVVIHWLGEAFDPALAGYWGSPDFEGASATCLSILEEHASKIDGIKLSLLDQEKEVELRRRLPVGVRMYTGDDFDYPTTIAGDGEHHSDALLGAFDFAAPAAAWSLEALDAGDVAEFHRRLDPTLELSRHVFSAPTFYYKTGVVFLAYLNGFQSHFKMVGGLESGRSVVHLATLFRLADEAGLLCDADLATARMAHVLALAGVE